MKLSNFELISPDLRAYRYRQAWVDVETGLLWWRRKERRRIALAPYATYWIFVDTGEYIFNSETERLVRAWEVQRCSG